MKALYTFVVAIVVILTLGYFYIRNQNQAVSQKQILSFEDCLAAGYIVMESYPRQCRAPDGKVFAEEIELEYSKYVNATANDITVDLPTPGAVVGKQFSIIGRARGTWYFEASFPVEVLDKTGKILYQGPVQAQGDWMTENFVNFKLDIIIPENYIGVGTIVLKKDNPSGEPERDASLSIPITIEY